MRLNDDFFTVTPESGCFVPGKPVTFTVRLKPEAMKEPRCYYEATLFRTSGGAETLLQTYYACDLENIEPERAKRMVEYMQIVRDVAQETGTLLNDNDTRWAALRDSDIETYRLLMLNAMHVNPMGNMVIGLDLMRLFDLPLRKEYRETCMTGLIAQALLDRLEKSRQP